MGLNLVLTHTFSCYSDKPGMLLFDLDPLFDMHKSLAPPQSNSIQVPQIQTLDWPFQRAVKHNGIIVH